MKELEGKTVWLKPTGNNAERGNPYKIIKARMKKVARVFVTITPDGFRLEEKLRMEDNRHISNEHNGGYIVFASEQEIKDYYEVQKLAWVISERFQYSGDYGKLDLKTLRKVAELLKVTI